VAFPRRQPQAAIAGSVNDRMPFAGHEKSDEEFSRKGLTQAGRV
jgi:hypothetical protein